MQKHNLSHGQHAYTNNAYANIYICAISATNDTNDTICTLGKGNIVRNNMWKIK